MEKQVIFRDRQEVQAKDMNDIETFANDSMKHIVADGITTGRRFTGFSAVASTDTEITVAPGRVYQGGDVYTLTDTTSFNMFQYLTVATKRVVALVAYGAAMETDTQPRDFLIDITSGATEPQAVPMQLWKKANLNLVAGVESADPVAPSIGENTVLIALITMSTTKVDSIEFMYGNILPNAEENEQDIAELNSWKAQISPQVDNIQTQIAGLQEQAGVATSRTQFLNLATEFARLREIISQPEGTVSYDADRFIDATKTDTGLTGNGAIVDAGLNFAKEASAMFPLQLFNPLETRVKKYASDFVLPAFTEEDKIQTTGYSGDLALSAYQVTTKVTKLVTETVQRYISGYWYNPYASWLYSFAPGGNFPGSYYYSYYQTYYYSPGYYTTDTKTYYKETDETVSYNGAMVAQTFLAPNAFWLTSIDLNFTDVAASGPVTVGICYTDAGQPDMTRTLVTATVNPGDLKKYPAKTNIPMPPAWIEAGKRYAVFIITQGAHRVATVSGNNYTQGTLFFSTDQAWFEGDITKDLMFSIKGAAFTSPRVEVALQNLSLAGGITDIDIETKMIVPAGTELSFEVQIAGVWQKLSQGDVLFTPRPNLIPLRMVLVGTRDAMPGIQFGADLIEVSRVGTGLAHFSALRSIGASTTDVTVTVSMVRFDNVNHTVACQLVDAAGANPVNPATVQTATEAGSNGLTITRKTYSFTPSARTSYKIKISGTRTSGSVPFNVIERADVAL